ncbi:unnamed protein product, partial [Ectocarpus sp. 4 AP-2014]
NTTYNRSRGVARSLRTAKAGAELCSACFSSLLYNGGCEDVGGSGSGVVHC